ncbi:MAG: transposase zinc-binding domain-containing protein, partial [Acidobacteria bacterium]|nr:transposase zinc-binding domain-containing protein [Acidobacteriota bacterium]
MGNTEGHVWDCDRCGQRQYAYHSCENRHCP